MNIINKKIISSRFIVSVLMAVLLFFPAPPVVSPAAAASCPPAGTRTDYPVGNQPRRAVFDPVTNSVWVTNGLSDTVSKVNINTGTRTDYPVGSDPWSAAFDPVTNSVWVANRNSNTVSKVNINTGARTDYPAGAGSWTVAFDSITNSIWIANGSADTVSKMNINTGARTDYPVGNEPRGSTFDPVTSSIWVTNGMSNTVSKVNINTGARTDYPVGSTPRGVTFDPVTNSVWVANRNSNTVSKVNINTGARTDYPIGNTPFSVDFDSVTNSIWVANSGDNTVSKVNINTGTRTDYPVGVAPWGMTFDSVTNSIWVMNSGADTVSKISIGCVANTDPTASITIPTGNISVTQETSVSFSGSGTDTDAGDTITAYEWREGVCDTGTLLSSASSFNLTTPTTGVRTVYLRVKDSQGAWSANCPSRVITITTPLSGSVIPSVPTDIVAQNLLISGALQPGQPITFSAEVKNQSAVGMDTTNSYGLVTVGTGSGEAIENITMSPPLGDVIYTFTGPSGTELHLKAWDIADPQNIIRTSDLSYSTNIGGPRSYNGFVVSGNKLYACNYFGDSGEKRDVMIFDISAPKTPVLLGGYNIPNQAAEGCALYKDKYLVTVSQGSSYIYDVSNPASPVKLGMTVTDTDADSSNNPWGVAVAGDYAFIFRTAGGAKDIEVFDISDPSIPVSVSNLDLTSLSQPYQASVIRGSYLYVSYNNTLYIVDISNPSNLTIKNTIIGGGDIAFSGDYMYSDNGVFNLSDPINPVKVSLSAPSQSYAPLEAASKHLISLYNYNIQLKEPHVFARVCIDNPNCLTSTVGRIGVADSDAGSLVAGAFTAVTSTPWTATLGTHTVFFCADPKDASGFDGVFETDEAVNNCVSQTFTVASGTLEVCELTSSGWFPRANGSSLSSPAAGNTTQLKAFFDMTAGDCAGTEVTSSAMWTELTDPNNVFTVGTGTLAVSGAASGNGNSGSLRVAYSGQTDDLFYTLPCFPSVTCSSSEADYCTGQSFTVNDPSCGIQNCTGTRYCDYNWKEVAP